jgi:hypothetical protein
MKTNNETKVEKAKTFNKARNDRKHHIKIEHNLQFEELQKEWDGFSVEEKNVLRYKRKWQKFLRWKTRNKRHFSRKNPSGVPALDKSYNLYVSYDKRLAFQVKNALKDAKIETWFKSPNIVTDIYLYIKGVNKETVEKFKEWFANVTCTANNKTYVVHIQATVAKVLIEKKAHKDKKPTNNTPECKLRAKVVRKLKNLRYFDILESLEKGQMSLKDAATWAMGKNHKRNLESKKSKKLPRKLKKLAKQSKPSPVGKKPVSVAKKGQNKANLKSNKEKKAA